MGPPGACGALEGGAAWATGGGGGARYTGRGPVCGMMTRRGAGVGGGGGGAISGDGVTAAIESAACGAAVAVTSGTLAAGVDTGSGVCGLGCAGGTATTPE